MMANLKLNLKIGYSLYLNNYIFWGTFNHLKVPYCYLSWRMTKKEKMSKPDQQRPKPAKSTLLACQVKLFAILNEGVKIEKIEYKS